MDVWHCGKERINRYLYLSKDLSVAVMNDEMGKNHVKLYGHVWEKLTICVSMMISNVTEARGRPKKSLLEKKKKKSC